MKIIVIAAAAAYERKALEVSNKCLVLCVKLSSLARETGNVTRAEDKAK